MSFLLISYLINSGLLFFLGILFYRKYSNLGGVFFLCFCSATALWFIFFILSYFSTQNLNLILLYWKTAYYLSIMSLYSFVLFLLNFHRGKEDIYGIKLASFWSISFLLGYLYIYSPFIIDGLYFDSELQDWYEQPWVGYSMHLILSFLFIPLSIISWVYRFKHISAIDKKRLQYIFIWMLIFIGACFLFLLVLPAFWVKWQVDKYISFFFIPFIVWVYYSIRRYDFLDFKLTLVNFLLFFYSLLSSFFIVNIFKNYSSNLESNFKNYWWFSESSFFIEFLIGIICFLVIYSFSENKLKTFFTQNSFYQSIETMKNKIPFITHFKELNSFLKLHFKENLNIDGVTIQLWKSGTKKLIKAFFEKNKSFDFIILDTSFLFENRKKLGLLYEKLIDYDKNSYMLLPLRNEDSGTIWYLQLWSKSLRDPFLSSELQSLFWLTQFLCSHLRYIDIYKQIQDLTFSLDKKVDEKTIEYNNLLNKQKEFIAYVGHEIKNPITNALFLTDALRDSTADIWNKDAIEDSSILYDELAKISKLVKHIFSAEKFDLDKVQLYRENISLSEFLVNETRWFTHKFPSIEFIDDIQWSVDYKIDETQFRQVTQNLINNAIKFINNSGPKVLISLEQRSGSIRIQIEDNGTWFDKVDVSEIFDKYSTWEGWSIWLGMGLYLCKKIVELHGGKITARGSSKLGGACFIIEL